jgi:hypothetical protein
MKTFLLTEQQRDILIAYLMERPFKEVATGIAQLQALPEAPPPAPPAAAEPKKD